MSGLLFVVATPIGNLEDVTLRALRVLREADLVAAEDTRHTAKLLRHHGISTRMLSFHAHNTRGRIPQLLKRLAAGARVALVTDAGTPGISDPGAELVEACRADAIAVEVVPGPSASVAAAVASGFPLIPLTVFGFPPVRAKARAMWFGEAARTGHTFTFFEAPHRIARTLAECRTYFGNRQICVARELTKLHEQVLVGWLKDIKLSDVPARGELTLVVSPKIPVASTADASDTGVQAKYLEVSARTPNGSRRDILVQVAKELGMPRSEVYAALEREKEGNQGR
jgi:16S rRNA (cytidine1402-2'-O)-methyltransferase